MVDAQEIVVEKISSIRRVSEHADQLSETKVTCLAENKENVTEFARLNGLVSLQILLERKTFHSLGYASVSVISLPVSMEKPRNEVRKVFEERDEFQENRNKQKELKKLGRPFRGTQLM